MVCSRDICITSSDDNLNKSRPKRTKTALRAPRTSRKATDNSVAVINNPKVTRITHYGAARKQIKSKKKNAALNEKNLDSGAAGIPNVDSRVTSSNTTFPGAPTTVIRYPGMAQIKHNDGPNAIKIRSMRTAATNEEHLESKAAALPHPPAPLVTKIYYPSKSDSLRASLSRQYWESFLEQRGDADGQPRQAYDAISAAERQLCQDIDMSHERYFEHRAKMLHNISDGTIKKKSDAYDLFMLSDFKVDKIYDMSVKTVPKP